MALPASLAPQLATLVEAAPTGGEWAYEMKFDGYRMLARSSRKRVRLFSRNGHDWSARLPQLCAALEALRLGESWIDGEVVALDEHGAPHFSQLQAALEAKDTSALRFFAFDLPFAGGKDLREQPLEVRRARLRKLLPAGKAGIVAFSEAFSHPPAQLLASACELRLEGLIGKRLGSPYVSGRSRDWIKLKCKSRQEFVIAGFSSPQGLSSGFGALLLGVHEGDSLRYAGRVGTGFDAKAIAALHPRLLAIKVARPALRDPPTASRDQAVTWVSPRLVAEVEFAQWTADGLLRHAVFKGLRSDKPARAITREQSL